MNAAEVVIGEMQCDGGFQVRQLLAERIGKPREAAHLHPHRQILALYKRRGNMVGVGTSVNDLGYNLRDLWWGVPPGGIAMLAEISEQV